MPSKRTERVGHQLQMEISKLILTRLKDPRLGFVTITHVGVAPDLKSAAVFYSSLGDKTAREKTQIALDHAVGFLQKEIGATLQLRYVPRLKFLYDDSIDRGLEIEQVLRKIQNENQDQQEPPSHE